MWNDAMAVVKEQLPPFNKKLLRDYRTNEVNNSIEYVNTVFPEAMKLFKGEIVCKGYKILTPEQRLMLLGNTTYHRSGYNIQRTELLPAQFEFQFENEIFTSLIYLPYMVNGAIIIDDTTFFVQVAEIERVFSRTKDGLIAKVMRSPLFFNRTEQLSFASTNGENFCDAVITTKLHSKKQNDKRKFKTALLLYFLSSFGLHRTLLTFEINPQDLVFVKEHDPTLTPDWYQFAIKPDLYLHVKKEVMESPIKRKVVASLLYCLLPKFAETQLDRINDPNGSMWKILLGKSIFGTLKTKDLAAHQYADAHLDSLSTYLDPFTQRELSVLGIEAHDIYDLLLLAFKNLHTWLTDHRSNDLYEKKMGVSELLMYGIVKDIFTGVYNNRQSNMLLSTKSVKQLLKFPSRKISGISRCGAVINAQIYHDNPLLYAFARRSRQPINLTSPSKRATASKKSNNLINSPEYRFDPSFLVIESILDLSSASPGASGSINPYCPITDTGAFYKPEWAKDLDPLIRYLPRR